MDGLELSMCVLAMLISGSLLHDHWRSIYFIQMIQTFSDLLSFTSSLFCVLFNYEAEVAGEEDVWKELAHDGAN